MAGDSDRMKQVYFIGAWRTQQVSDQLLRQISNQISLKKKVVTKLDISSEGLELLIFNSEGKVIRKDKIALENIVDFIDNKYSTTCTLAIVREKQQKLYTVFVFLCTCDRDAAAIIHTFKTAKKQLSGEGYNTNLTPKGTNWTLQQKDEKSVHKTLNGDVRGHTVIQVPGSNVRVISTEKQNGSVTVINNGDRHDSFSRESVRTSNSEVKEELHQLADEVRGIKKLLQGSKGRSQFEKHYGYMIVPDRRPEERHVEYTERNIITRPAEPIPGQVYVKNEANTRYINNAPQVIRTGRGVARNTRRYKSNAHFVTATSPTRIDYTKRVYDSKNPYVESGAKYPPSVKSATRSIRSVAIPRHRIYQSMSQSSDIVHKNIEDVYKSRSLRKVYLPPASSNGKTVEYVNSHMVQVAQHEHPQLPVKPLSAKEGEQTTVRVKYSPEIRTYIEPKESESVVIKTSSSNVSTNINTSVNDNFETRQIERNLDIEQREPEFKRDDNVVIVQTIQEVPQSYSEKIDESTVYIQNEDTNRSNDSNTIGGGVYHVRAEFAEDYEKTLANDEHVTIIESTGAKQDDVRITEPNYDPDNVETLANDEHVTIIRSTGATQYLDNAEVNTTAEKGAEENVGLFGAYTKKPEDHNEARDEIATETAYRYHDNEQNVELIHTEDNVEVKAIAENGEEENVGLFGAYTKTPDQHVEPRDEIITEMAYRYHDHEDESIVVENTAEPLQSMKEDGGLFGTYANRQEDSDESKTEIIKEASYQYQTKEIDAVEKNAETVYEQGKQEILEEKRVRYNDMVEQIPLVDNEPVHDVENVHHTNDVYEADKQEGETSQDEFRHELGAVVSRLRHSYDEKTKEFNKSDNENIEDEDKYEFDMDALRAFSTEPNIIILDADDNKKVENVSVVSKQSVHEEFEFGEKVLNKEDKNVDISDSAISAEIQKEREQSIITKEDIHEVFATTEDSVLF